MPVVKEREYRQMFQPLMIPQGTTEKRFDTDYYVEGFATTFNKPYDYLKCALSLSDEYTEGGGG